MSDPLDQILAKIETARDHLAAYSPAEFDWPGRCERAARELVPWLAEQSLALKAYVERILNAPELVRDEWNRLRPQVTASAERIAAFESALGDAELLSKYVGGDVASSIVMRHLQAEYPDSALRANGRSDYPDLYLRTVDYASLPAFTRAIKAFGAALKGKPPRPVRVPDGLEVKTCRDAIRVDCHHDHTGLHLVVVFTGKGGKFEVRDIAIAFLTPADYHNSARNTTATSEKFSFGRKLLISLLGESL